MSCKIAVSLAAATVLIGAAAIPTYAIAARGGGGHGGGGFGGGGGMGSIGGGGFARGSATVGGGGFARGSIGGNFAGGPRSFAAPGMTGRSFATPNFAGRGFTGRSFAAAGVDGRFVGHGFRRHFGHRFFFPGVVGAFGTYGYYDNGCWAWTPYGYRWVCDDYSYPY